MSPRLLLIGGNFFPEPTGIGKYNGEMVQWFAANGYECTVITTAPYYPYWKVQPPYTGKWFKKEVLETEGKNIEIYRCPFYVPSKPRGKSRLLSEISFTASAFFALLRVLSKKRFDYVLTVVPPFQLGMHALLYKFFRGSKFLYHIQDLQIEAARDLGMIKSKAVIKGLFGIEKKLLRKADMVSTISTGMQKKIEEKTSRAVTLFPNWVDIDNFFPLSNKEEIRQQYGFRPEHKIILYSGAVGEKQGLEILLLAAKKLECQKHIQFIISGNGPYVQALKKMAEDIGVSSLHFLPLQPAETFNQFLNMADLHLVIQKGDAADLMMPSKLSTILAVGGLALVTAAKGSSLYDLVYQNNIGITVHPEDANALAASITYALEKDYTLVKQTARSYALTHLSKETILSRYQQKIAALYNPSFSSPSKTPSLQPAISETTPATTN